MITPAQCRAARGLLDWSQQDLADAAKVGNTTICNFEGGRSLPQKSKLAALQGAFERAGVTLVEEDDGGIGVRMIPKSLRPASIPLEELNAENDE
ncbi:MAG TPA: helix-turn-helix transcriptional regulator [Methylocystis sp.]|nr:helix-turn-helix transcriptional regulator [Methylocystis sp.]